MNGRIALLAVIVLSVGLMTNAYAHKAQVVGNYKIEVGWKDEPPIVNKKNAIEITVTQTTAAAKKSSTDHESHDHADTKTKTKTAYEKPPSVIKLVSSDKAATEHKHDEKPKTTKSTKKMGVSGLSKTLEADITLNGKKTFLKLTEDKQKKGTYYGSYTPTSVGHPTVHLVGKIKSTPIELSFHPEKVESSK
jgi:hypothetical protein